MNIDVVILLMVVVIIGLCVAMTRMYKEVIDLQEQVRMLKKLSMETASVAIQASKMARPR